MHEVVVQFNDLPDKQFYYLFYTLPDGKNCVDICPVDKLEEYIEQAFKELKDGRQDKGS